MIDPYFLLTVCSVYVALLLLAGYVLVCTCLGRRERHWAEVYGLSFTAGSGTISLLLFVFSLAGFAPSKGVLAVIAVGATIVLAVLVKNKWLVRPSVPTRRKRIDPLFFVGMLAAATVLASAYNVQARAGWAGLGDIDTFAIWMFKAKWVALAPLRPIPPAFHDPGLSYSHQDYPLAFPFLIAGICALGGSVNEELAKSLLLPQYLALVAVIYSAMRRIHRRAVAATVTAIFAAAPVIAQNAGLVVAETPLILTYAASLAMLLRWMENESLGELIMAGFFTVIAAFTKNEGLAMLPVIGAASVVFAVSRRPDVRRRTLMHCFVAAVVSVVLISPWLIFRCFLPRTHEDYGGKLMNSATIIHNLPRLSQIVPGFFGQMLTTQNAGLVWMVLAIVATIGWRGLSRGSVRVLWAVLLVQLALYTATFVVTPWDVTQLLGLISPKLLVQASPVAALLIGLHMQEPGGWPEAGSLRNSASTGV